LKNDPEELAKPLGVSESTIRRWLKDELAKFQASQAAHADPNEMRVED
jgi:DeoR/GlpR family transcriptional regulator of sugar metabolism